MQLTKTDKKILKKYKKVFEMLENYDKTREFPFHKKRIDITLSVKAIEKLKKLKEKTGKPISHIIEEQIQRS
ncbi:MAG TPA: ribbon-helix-helix protein, CopG family [Candidatus Nanoarchaeia archaeon]|nr:ribbon-helix-helix protein, CopG family [Candidatus Nanoarchaeia archaeon]